jgi:hypothetical protein
MKIRKKKNAAAAAAAAATAAKVVQPEEEAPSAYELRVVGLPTYAGGEASSVYEHGVSEAALSVHTQEPLVDRLGNS